MLLDRGFQPSTERRTVDRRRTSDLKPLLRRAESRPRTSEPALPDHPHIFRWLRSKRRDGDVIQHFCKCLIIPAQTKKQDALLIRPPIED